jgi:murein DD-endopeptidase MepM/ murein hydrolase activator NlpD
MRPKSLKIIIFLLVTAILIISGYEFYQNKRFPGRTTENEYDILENAIILDGLEMDSEFSMTENQNNIIYDDNFGNSLTKETRKPKQSKRSNHRKVTQKKSKKNRKKNIESRHAFILKLKRNDKRWHYTEHKIKKGEHLWKIAQNYNISHTYIIKANKITKPDMLHPGKTILVPNRIGLNYTIKRGDTLTAIAKRYNSKVTTITKHNKLRKNKIKVDQVIFIPGGYKKSYEKKKNRLTRNNTPKINKSKRKTDFTLKKKPNTNEVNRLKFSWPLKGKITSAFGRRTDPFTKRKKFHCGIDISSIEGTKVKAAQKGKIIFSGWKNKYGKIIVIQHKSGYITVYAHLSKLLKKVNDQVNKSDIIALSGKTGAVTGAHLHFEIRKHLTPLNPLRLIL